MPPVIQRDIPLAPLTSIGLGARARFFGVASSISDIKYYLEYAMAESLPVYVLGGGSNTIFPDTDYEGLVLQIALNTLSHQESPGKVIVQAGAGMIWDHLVETCVQRGWAGLECLSGIPGSAGATPIQNVGAYGQEVADSLSGVFALDRTTLKEINFLAEECDFGYRFSRFKGRDQGRYIITGVEFQLEPDGEPSVRYSELQRKLAEEYQMSARSDPRARLQMVRHAVLELRRAKSMLLDASDPNSKSCGSYFMNPLLDIDQLQSFQNLCVALEIREPPIYPVGALYKTSAAWLIDHAGFARGYQKGGVGISQKHTLALINRAGSTTELLALQNEIIEKVDTLFGIRLEREPVIVMPHNPG